MKLAALVSAVAIAALAPIANAQTREQLASSIELNQQMLAFGLAMQEMQSISCGEGTQFTLDELNAYRVDAEMATITVPGTRRITLRELMRDESSRCCRDSRGIPLVQECDRAELRARRDQNLQTLERYQERIRRYREMIQ